MNTMCLSPNFSIYQFMAIFYNLPPRLDNLNSIYIILLGAYYRKIFLIFQQLNYKQTWEPQFFTS